MHPDELVVGVEVELDERVGLESVAGAVLCARSAATRDRLARALDASPASVEFAAIVRTPPWRDGCFEERYAGRPAATRFEVVETRGGASLLSLTSDSADPKAIRFPRSL